jgi:glycosyltransferase involved in cell wall biosynthesis
MVRVLRRRKYVVLVHDVYPNVAVKLGYVKEGGIIAAVWGALNRIAYRQASAVIVLGSGMQHEVEKEIGERGPPVHIIHNWADGELLVPRSKGDNWFAARYKMQEKLVLLYSGNIGLAHDMETIIEATACLREYSSQLRVLFIGEGAKKAKLMSLVEQRGLTNVHFLPPVPYEQLPYSIAAGDIGLVTLEKGLEGLCEPSKVYGYLAVGLAILGLTGELSEVAEIIQRHECGYRVDQGDVEGVVKALIRWLDNPAELQQMKTNARRCFQKYYEKRHAIAKYLEVLEDV